MPAVLTEILTFAGGAVGLASTIIGSLWAWKKLEARTEAARAEGALEGTKEAVEGAQTAASNWEGAVRAAEARHERERQAWEAERDGLKAQLQQALERISALEVEQAKLSARPDVDAVAEAVERHNAEAEKRALAFTAAIAELTDAIRDLHALREPVAA